MLNLKKNNEKDIINIAQALSDSYYAIYVINCEKETYTILKGEEYIKEVLPRHGKYEDLINCFESIIEEYAYAEFKEVFSIDNIRKLVRSGTQNFGGDYKRKFGNEYKWVNVQMLYNQDNKNEVIFASQDIDARKQKELEEKVVLMESIETMQAVTQSKNRFFANMSHDMRIPLNAIVNLSKMAEEQINDREKVFDYLNKINISSTQLLDLVNDILEVSKMEENASLVNNVIFNIKCCLDSSSV